MTDAELVEKKAAFIETCVEELRTLAKPEELRSDVRERRFAEHTLQVAIQAALDIASHVVSEKRLGEPRTNRELFAALVGADLISSRLGTRLEAAAGFRNIVVHGYGDVNLDVLRDILENHLGDLEAFAQAIRSLLKT